MLFRSSLGRRWTYEDEGYANRFVSLYDPQKIWEFTGGMMKCLSQTKDCSPELQKLIREEGSLFQMGETQIFRDSVTEEYERPMGDGGSSVKEKITRKVEQPVRGFVWRLR